MARGWLGVLSGVLGSNGLRNRSLLSALLICTLFTGIGCSTNKDDGATETETAEGEKSADGEENEETDDRVPVETVAIGRGSIAEVLRFTTNLEAENDVQVFSQAARLITGLYVEEGDDVRKGQILIRLEDEQQRTQVTRVESQLGKAKREYERQQRLYEQSLISEQVYNDATYDLEQLELALADAKRELSYTGVRAPISGTVTQRLINVGDQITMNQHLFDIVDFDSIVARIYVPEKSLPRLAKGQIANLTSDAFGGEPRQGKVDRIAPLVDSRSGTVKVTVGIPRGEALRPGMYVNVELITETHDDAVLIPKRALVYDDEQVFVFRLASEMRDVEKDESEDGESEDEQEESDDSPAEQEEVTIVERLLVRPLLEDREWFEPAGTIAEGDSIVVAGQAGLKDKAVVRVIGAENE